MEDSFGIIGWCFKFLWDNFFAFMNWELHFGDISITLWEFMLGSIIVFTLIIGLIRGIFIFISNS